MQSSCRQDMLPYPATQTADELIELARVIGTMRCQPCQPCLPGFPSSTRTRQPPSPDDLHSLPKPNIPARIYNPINRANIDQRPTTLLLPPQRPPNLSTFPPRFQRMPRRGRADIHRLAFGRRVSGPATCRVSTSDLEAQGHSEANLAVCVPTVVPQGHVPGAVCWPWWAALSLVVRRTNKLSSRAGSGRRRLSSEGPVFESCRAHPPARPPVYASACRKKQGRGWPWKAAGCHVAARCYCFCVMLTSPW
ncbi:hypothetical protein F5X68DRAFT_10543 [Plectosphaerella plurivora]|uniref:Uncharacterized protein n=1 Tax=Plectosphaerella plurivora TaxID=936078 RepID=A0A9P8VD52_9PEZI|nr:hypothetical protein F5X68DRAFT_10543 [Plectosphaerella plurivora]